MLDMCYVIVWDMRYHYVWDTRYHYVLLWDMCCHYVLSLHALCTQLHYNRFVISSHPNLPHA